MAEKMNMVWGTEYRDAVAGVKEFNRVCYGFHTEEQFYAFTEQIKGLQKNMKFLDFGCGPGRIVKTVAPEVKEYVGVDVSAGLLEMAREHHKEYTNVSFVKGNGTDLRELEDNDFDYLYSRLVLIHVPKEWIVGYVIEFFRVLKLGGILFIPDFPRADMNANGFTMEEMNEMFKDFAQVSVERKDNTYTVDCVK